MLKLKGHCFSSKISRMVAAAAAGYPQVAKRDSSWDSHIYVHIFLKHFKYCINLDNIIKVRPAWETYIETNMIVF